MKNKSNPENPPAAVQNQAPNSIQDNVKIFCRSLYDFQKLRISMGNRLCAQFFVKLGIQPGEKHDKDKEAEAILDQLKASYAKITDGVKRELPTKARFKGHGLISDYAELCLIHGYIQQEKHEEALTRRLDALLEDVPLWTEYLKDVHGCGPKMTGVILSTLDPHIAIHPSHFWAYAGYSVSRVDGKAISRRTEHLRDVHYKDKDGKPAVRKGLCYNPWLRTKMFVLAGCFIKGRNPKYEPIYRDYRNRLDNRPLLPEGHPKYRPHQVHSGSSAGHKHMASVRYMMKIFLLDLWKKWRELEGLPVTESYAEAKLGIYHGQESGSVWGAGIEKEIQEHLADTPGDVPEDLEDVE